MSNTIEDNNVKCAVFLSVVGDTTYHLIRVLLSPKKLTEVDFNDIIVVRWVVCREKERESQHCLPKDRLYST